MESTQLTEFVAHYLTALFWSESDEGGQPFDANYSPSDLSDADITAVTKDCAAFIRLAESEGLADDDGHGISQLAHGFCLTRNGHGAGFWDGDWPIHGDALTALSKRFGECGLYLGDDGEPHYYSSSKAEALH